MTPEELNRTMEFIVQTQTRLAAAQEQDGEDRVQFEKWSKGLFAQMAEDRKLVVQLLDHQSRRMDRYDEFMRKILAQLDRILDKLSDSPN